MLHDLCKGKFYGFLLTLAGTNEDRKKSMHSIGLDDVGSALLITLIMLIVSLTVVGLAMWWLYRVFKNKDDKTAQTDENTGSKGQTSDR